MKRGESKKNLRYICKVSFLRCKLVSLVLLGFLQSLLQKPDVGGCGRVLKACGEAECGFVLLRLHGSLVQEEVGIDVVDLEETQANSNHEQRIRKIATAQTRRFLCHLRQLWSVQLTTVPLGSATIISTGKLYLSRCSRAFSLNERFSSSACRDRKMHFEWFVCRCHYGTLK